MIRAWQEEGILVKGDRGKMKNGSGRNVCAPVWALEREGVNEGEIDLLIQWLFLIKNGCRMK